MISYSRQIGVLSSSAQSIAATTTISFQAKTFYLSNYLCLYINREIKNEQIISLFSIQII